MLSVINRLRLFRLDKRGTTALEFALVAVPFLFLMIGTTDLGRYFLTQHSLRTLTAEAARAVMVNCFSASARCYLTPTEISAVKAKVPFLIPNSTALNAFQEGPSGATGLRNVTVTAVYPFSFIFYLWSGKSGNITETTSISY
jgi:Flp pilus assembly protein TadG